MEFSTEALKPIAEQFASLLMGTLNLEEGQLVRAVETDIRRGLQEIGRQTLGLILSQAEVVPQATLPCECGGRLHYQRRRRAQVLSVFNWVEYERHYYAGCACGQGKAPLDERFGLQAGQVTAGLADLLALTGAELAFEQSRRFLERFLLFGVSENTVRKETECFGQLQAEWERLQKERSQNPDYLQERLRAHDQLPERLYGSLDGAKVRIEERQKATQPAEKVSASQKWREIKVGCWYLVEAVPKSQQRRRHRRKAEIGHQALRTRDMSYFCEIEAAETFGDLFWASGCQRQADLADEVVFVCDGAQWIWRLIEHSYPQATQIVDWFHAEERLEKVAREISSPSLAQEWLETVRTCLWEGDVSFVIQACHKLVTHSQEAAQAVTYFSNNAHRMAYHQFRTHGYMIGSGPVESGCKQIVSQRLKRSGAQWQVTGANHTAKARAAWLSGDWEVLCSRRDALPLAV